MSESDRVQRWRQRQREAGKEPLTVWLTSAEKLRLEDMALRQRCSPSEIVQRMLAQWHGESQPVTDTVTDAKQIRAIVQQELTKAQTVTATVTDTVTDTLHQALPGLMRALLSAQQAENATATATDTVTDTSISPREDSRPEPAPSRVADTVADTVVVPMTYPVPVTVPATVVVPMTYPVTDTVTATVTDTDSAPSAKRKAPSRQRPVTATVADNVTVTEAKHRRRPPVLRPGILALLDDHPEGLTTAELKVYLGTEKHIGDTLAGMVKAHLLVKNGSGPGLRYQRADSAGKAPR